MSAASPSPVGTAPPFAALETLVQGLVERRGGEACMSWAVSSTVASLRADGAAIWAWEEAGKRLRLVAEAGTGAFSQAEPLAANVASSRKAVVSTRLPGGGFFTGHPLTLADDLLGVMGFLTAEPVGGDHQSWWRIASDATALAAHETTLLAASRHTNTKLALLFEATRLLNSTLDLAELLELILRIARSEIPADRGTVFIVDTKRQEIWSIVAQGLERQEIRLPMGQGIAGHVAQSGATVNSADPYREAQFDRSVDQRLGYHTESLLCMPIRHRSGEVAGVLQLLNHREGAFTREDEDFLERLSSHMALALDNARLHREALEKQRLEKELSLGREIQRGLLPEAPPVVKGFEIGMLNEPCYQVGGDYFDFICLDENTVLLLVADVEGKGVASALVMSNLQATLRALVAHMQSLEAMVGQLNDMILRSTRGGKYFSMFIARIDVPSRSLQYVNAGHVPPLLVRRDDSVLPLEEGGMVVGLFPAAQYQSATCQLESGDVLAYCTDGILEAMNREGEDFGAVRLAAALKTHRRQPAAEIVGEIAGEVASFAAGGDLLDDKVLVVVKVD
ncbi:MAG: PP2C family protein-serine/threonine phosphatase [Terriglobales bacterium]